MPTFYADGYAGAARTIDEAQATILQLEARVQLLEGLLQRSLKLRGHFPERDDDIFSEIDAALGVRAQLPDVVSTIEQAIAIERGVCYCAACVALNGGFPSTDGCIMRKENP